MIKRVAPCGIRTLLNELACDGVNVIICEGLPRVVVVNVLVANELVGVVEVGAAGPVAAVGAVGALGAVGAAGALGASGAAIAYGAIVVETKHAHNHNRKNPRAW